MNYTAREKKLIGLYSEMGGYFRSGKKEAPKEILDGIRTAKKEALPITSFGEKQAVKMYARMHTNNTSIKTHGDLDMKWTARAATDPIMTVDVPMAQSPLLLGKARMPHLFQLFVTTPLSYGNQLYTYEEQPEDGKAIIVPEAGALNQVSFPMIASKPHDMVMIGGYLKVSRELVSDAPAYAMAIDERLDYLVKLGVDSYILDSIELSGIGQVSGQGKSGILSALMQVAQNIGKQANCVVISNADFYAIAEADDSNHFFESLANRGVFVHVTDLMEQGSVLAMNLQSIGVLGEKDGFLMVSSNSNEDDFVKNMVTHKEIWYGTFAVVNPEACVMLTLIGGA